MDGSGTPAQRTDRNGRSWTGVPSTTDHSKAQAAVKMTPTATMLAGATAESRRPARAPGRPAALRRGLPALPTRLGCCLQAVVRLRRAHRPIGLKAGALVGWEAMWLLAPSRAR